MTVLRINGAGDGAWIMDLVHGTFDPRHDHAICAVRDGVRLGGFVFCHWLGASLAIHMGGTDPRWCSRDLLWMVFDYVFHQLGCNKALASVDSANRLSLSQCLRAGWQVEAVIRHAYTDGDLIILSMTRAQCRWLAHRPQRYRSNQAVGVS